MNDEITIFKSKEIFAKPNTGFDCHIWDKSETCFHKHVDYCEFCLITSGRVQYRFENQKSRTLSKGDMVFVAPGQSHKFANYRHEASSQITVSLTEQKLTMLMEDFDPQQIIKNMPSYKKISSVTENYLVQLTDKVLTYQNENAYMYYIKHWINTALTDMYDFNHTIVAYPQFFTDILSFMNKPCNLAKKINEIIEELYISNTTMNKYFKKYLNTTPNAYFLSLKIKYAKHLLLRTDLGILDISGKVGFDSLSHFNHLFKQQTGTTPYKYRTMQTRKS